MNLKIPLTSGEILAIFSLLSLNGATTTEELKDFMKTSDQYARNIIVKLRKKGIIQSFGATALRTGIIFGSPITKKTLKPRQKLHILTKGLDDLVTEYPEILKFAKSVINVDSLAELKKYLEEIRKNKAELTS